MNLTLTGVWLPTDPDVGSHRLLPFDVSTGISRIDVRYSAQAIGDGSPAPLDIGLFDPAGVDFLDAQGFRGWSGAFRSEFFVSAADSTPGYLRGPIAPGEWHIFTGTGDSGLPASGLRYTIEITLTEGDHVPALPYAPYDPGVAQPRPGWYRGNLHSHTYYSDGHNSIAEMADEHRRLGLHFGALTEHNIFNPDLAHGHRPGFVWLPSEEITHARGHMNVWGLSHWLDFRCDREEQLQMVIEAARAQGALTSINHPKDDGPPWSFELFTTDCMEVWQAPWFLGNYQSLALWDRLLREGKRIVAVGGSDLHRISTPDNPYPYLLDNPATWVRAPELSIAGILEGISRGHVFISRDARGPQVYLTAEAGPVSGSVPTPGGGSERAREAGDVVSLHPGMGLTVRCDVLGGSGLILRLVTQDGAVHIAPIPADDFRAEYLWSGAGAEAAGGPTFIRAEVIRDMGPEVDLEEEPSAIWMEAMSNPIYVSMARPVLLEAEQRATADVESKVPVATSVHT